MVPDSLDMIVRTVKSPDAFLQRPPWTATPGPDENVRVREKATARKAEENPLAQQIGARIVEAMELTGIPTQAALQNLTGLHDRTLRRYLDGTHVPQVESLISIAAVCRVSIDWLVLGRDELRAMFFVWLETPAGHGASDAEKAALRTLPTKGYLTTIDFYDRALDVLRQGVTMSPEDVAKVARRTERAR